MVKYGILTLFDRKFEVSIYTKTFLPDIFLKNPNHLHYNSIPHKENWFRIELKTLFIRHYWEYHSYFLFLRLLICLNSASNPIWFEVKFFFFKFLKRERQILITFFEKNWKIKIFKESFLNFFKKKELSNAFKYFNLIKKSVLNASWILY